MTEEYNFENRMADPQFTKWDDPLRPKSFNEYIGQVKAKNNLSICIEAAKKRGEPLDHVLLCGPHGIGKSTFAEIIAREMGVGFRVISGSAIENPSDLAALLTNLRNGDVLFMDEIHRLSRTVEAMLYHALDNYVIDLTVGSGAAARSIRIDLPRFTLIGATTRLEQLPDSLRDRFGIIHHFYLYSTQELEEIIYRSADILGVTIDIGIALYKIASLSHGTPRIANRLLKRVRDYADIMGDGRITKGITEIAIESMEIENFGLDSPDESDSKGL